MTARVEALKALMGAFREAAGERKTRLGYKVIRALDMLDAADAYVMRLSRNGVFWDEYAVPGPRLSAEEKAAIQPIVREFFHTKAPVRPAIWVRGSLHKAQRIAKREQKRTDRQAERRAGKAYVVSETTRAALEKIAGDCAREMLSDQDFRRQLREDAQASAKALAESLRAAREG